MLKLLNKKKTSMHNIFLDILFFIAGTCFGSFIFCLEYRKVNNLSLKGRSICDKCGHTLSNIDLMPLFGYLINKGRCKYCRKKIDISSFIVELISGIFFLLLYIKWGLSTRLLELIIVYLSLLYISLYDLSLSIIPDSALTIIFVVNIVFKLINRFDILPIINSLINGLLISLPLLVLRIVMNKVLHKESMGLGDIKLFFIMGMYLNFRLNYIVLLISSTFGFIHSFVKKENEIPFGPSISLAYMLVLTFVEFI